MQRCDVTVFLLVLVFSAHVSVGCPPGTRGEQGTQGLQGLQGVQGPPGASFGIIVQYSNGTHVGSGADNLVITSGDDLTQVNSMVVPAFDVYGNDISELVNFFFAQTGSSNPTLLFITYQNQGYVVYKCQQPGSSGGGGTAKSGPHLAARPSTSSLSITHIGGSLTSLPNGANVTLWATKTGNPGTNGNNGADGAEGPQGPPGPPAARVGSRIWVDAIYGNDTSGTGSVDAPFQTINQAITLVSTPNNATAPVAWEINLAAGSYDELQFEIPNNVILRGAGWWQTWIVNGFTWTPTITTGWGITLEVHDLSINHFNVDTTAAGLKAFVFVRNCWIQQSDIITDPNNHVDSTYTANFYDSYIWHVTFTSAVEFVGCQIGPMTLADSSVAQFTGNNFWGELTLASSAMFLYMTGCTAVRMNGASFSWNIQTSGSQVFADSTCATTLGQGEGLTYQYIDDASSIGYSAQNDLNWAESPPTVAIALDQLAARSISATDASIAIGGSSDAVSVRATGVFAYGIQQPIRTPLPVSSITQDTVVQGFAYYESSTANMPVDSASNICTGAGISSGYYMKMLFVNIGAGTVTLTTSHNSTTLFTQPIGPTSQRTLAFLCESGPLLSVFG